MILDIPKLKDLKLLEKLKPTLLDDPVDRLNYRSAATIILFLAAMVSAKQFTGSPIQCWTPNEFTKNWGEFAHDYCLSKSTYYSQPPDNETVSHDGVLDNKESHISYYQWVPVILALQAIAFMLPNWMWKTMIGFFGMELEGCITVAKEAKAVHGEDRNKKIEVVTTMLAEGLGIRDRDRFRNRDRRHKFGADYLSNAVTSLYLFTKMLYVINLIAQLILLSTFLGFNDIFWGFTNFHEAFFGSGWETTGLFPRITYCDFGVRVFSAYQKYTLQCVLLLNMFNEKIFVFLWFLLAGLLIVTSISAFWTLYNYCKPTQREKAVYRWLKHAPDCNDDYLERFTHDSLKSDGLLVLRFIEYHAGLGIAREVATKLWLEYINPCDATTMSVMPTNDNGDYTGLNNITCSCDRHKSSTAGSVTSRVPKGSQTKLDEKNASNASDLSNVNV